MIDKRDFISWIKKTEHVDKSNGLTIIFDEQGNISSNTPLQKIVRSIEDLQSHITQELSNGIHPRILIHANRTVNYTIDLRHIPIDKYIHLISIQGNGSINFVGGYYKEIKINSSSNTEFHYEFDSCNIGALEISSCPNYYAKYSSIGVLHSTGSSAIRNIELSNCNILGLTANNSNLCAGDFIIDSSTYFSDKTSIDSDISLLDNKQVYSNIRKAEQERGNILVANLFHVLEFKSSRTHEKWQIKIFNYLYQWISNYGTSTARPLTMFIILFFITTTISFNEDAVELQQSEEFYKGWQKSLLVKDNKLTQSIVLSTQSIINFGGIIGTKNLVVAKEGTNTSYWLFIHSLLSITSLTMFIFALRRRFKMNL